jgi:hypothetical protein
LDLLNTSWHIAATGGLNSNDPALFDAQDVNEPKQIFSPLAKLTPTLNNLAMVAIRPKSFQCALGWSHPW